VKAGVRAISSNAIAGQAKPEIVSATSVKTWESTKKLSLFVIPHRSTELAKVLMRNPELIDWIAAFAGMTQPQN